MNRMPVEQPNQKRIGRWILAAAVAAGLAAWFRPELQDKWDSVVQAAENHNKAQTTFKDSKGRYVTDFKIFGRGGFMVNGERLPEGSVLFLNKKPYMIYSHIIAQPTNRGRETFHGLLSRCVGGYIESEHFDTEQAYAGLTQLSGIDSVGKVQPGDYVVLPCDTNSR